MKDVSRCAHVFSGQMPLQSSHTNGTEISNEQKCRLFKIKKKKNHLGKRTGFCKDLEYLVIIKCSKRNSLKVN